MKTIFFFCCLLAIAASKPGGYYHQEYNYKSSSSSFKNNELQHKDENQGFYSKDGDLEGRVKPKVNSHSQHSEYTNPRLLSGSSGYNSAGGYASGSNGNYRASSDRLFGSGQSSGAVDGFASSDRVMDLSNVFPSGQHNSQGGYDTSSLGSYGSSQGAYGSTHGSYSNSYGGSVHGSSSSDYTQRGSNMGYVQRGSSYGTSGTYGLNSNLNSLEQRLQDEMSRQLESAIYNQYRSSGYTTSVSSSQMNADIRTLEDEIKRNLTRQLEDSLRSQYGQQQLRGSNSYTIIDGRPSTVVNYNNQELSDLTRRLEDNLLKKLHQNIHTTYNRETSYSSSNNAYQTIYPSSSTLRPYYSRRPIVIVPSNIRYTPIPNPESITQIASRIQSEINSYLDTALQNLYTTYIQSGRTTHYTLTDFDNEVNRLKDNIIRNLTSNLDEMVRRNYGQQILKDNNYYSISSTGEVSSQYNYNSQDYDNLRKQVEENLLMKLNQAVNTYRDDYQKQQSYTTQTNSYTVTYRPVYYTSGNQRYDYSDLQRQLSQQLQDALNKHRYSQSSYSTSTSYNPQAYQTSLDELTRELQRNLTEQLGSYRAQSSSSSYGYTSGSAGGSAGGSADFESMKNQLQNQLMQQLQQGLQKNYRYSASASYSASSSSGSNANFGGHQSYGNYENYMECCSPIGDTTTYSHRRNKRHIPYSGFVPQESSHHSYKASHSSDNSYVSDRVISQHRKGESKYTSHAQRNVASLPGVVQGNYHPLESFHQTRQQHNEDAFQQKLKSKLSFTDESTGQQLEDGIGRYTINRPIIEPHHFQFEGQELRNGYSSESRQPNLNYPSQQLTTQMKRHQYNNEQIVEHKWQERPNQDIDITSQKLLGYEELLGNHPGQNDQTQQSQIEQTSRHFEHHRSHLEDLNDQNQLQMEQESSRHFGHHRNRLEEQSDQIQQLQIEQETSRHFGHSRNHLADQNDQMQQLELEEAASKYSKHLERHNARTQQLELQEPTENFLGHHRNPFGDRNVQTQQLELEEISPKLLGHQERHLQTSNDLTQQLEMDVPTMKLSNNLEQKLQQTEDFTGQQTEINREHKPKTFNANHLRLGYELFEQIRNSHKPRSEKILNDQQQQIDTTTNELQYSGLFPNKNIRQYEQNQNDLTQQLELEGVGRLKPNLQHFSEQQLGDDLTQQLEITGNQHKLEPLDQQLQEQVDLTQQLELAEPKNSMIRKLETTYAQNSQIKPFLNQQETNDLNQQLELTDQQLLENNKPLAQQKLEDLPQQLEITSSQHKLVPLDQKLQEPDLSQQLELQPKKPIIEKPERTSSQKPKIRQIDEQQETDQQLEITDGQSVQDNKPQALQRQEDLTQQLELIDSQKPESKHKIVPGQELEDQSDLTQQIESKNLNTLAYQQEKSLETLEDTPTQQLILSNSNQPANKKHAKHDQSQQFDPTDNQNPDNEKPKSTQPLLDSQLLENDQQKTEQTIQKQKDFPGHDQSMQQLENDFSQTLEITSSHKPKSSDQQTIQNQEDFPGQDQQLENQQLENDFPQTLELTNSHKPKPSDQQILQNQDDFPNQDQQLDNQMMKNEYFQTLQITDSHPKSTNPHITQVQQPDNQQLENDFSQTLEMEHAHKPISTGQQTTEQVIQNQTNKKDLNEEQTQQGQIADDLAQQLELTHSIIPDKKRAHVETSESQRPKVLSQQFSEPEQKLELTHTVNQETLNQQLLEPEQKLELTEIQRMKTRDQNLKEPEQKLELTHTMTDEKSGYVPREEVENQMTQKLEFTENSSKSHYERTPKYGEHVNQRLDQNLENLANHFKPDLTTPNLVEQNLNKPHERSHYPSWNFESYGQSGSAQRQTHHVKSETEHRTFTNGHSGLSVGELSSHRTFPSLGATVTSGSYRDALKQQDALMDLLRQKVQSRPINEAAYGQRTIKKTVYVNGRQISSSENTDFSKPNGGIIEGYSPWSRNTDNIALAPEGSYRHHQHTTARGIPFGERWNEELSSSQFGQNGQISENFGGMQQTGFSGRSTVKVIRYVNGKPVSAVEDIKILKPNGEVVESKHDLPLNGNLLGLGSYSQRMSSPNAEFSPHLRSSNYGIQKSSFTEDPNKKSSFYINGEFMRSSESRQHISTNGRSFQTTNALPFAVNEIEHHGKPLHVKV